MTAFKDLLENYIDGAKQHVARKRAGPAPQHKSEKVRETFLWRRRSSIEHAKRVIEEGEFLLAAIEAKRDVWIIVQLALELGKLHERWKVDELKRRSANSRKGAETANKRFRSEAENTRLRVLQDISRLERKGMARRDIAKQVEKNTGIGARHVRRLWAQNKRPSR